MTAQKHLLSSTTDTRLLKASLVANAIFSVLSGLCFIVLSRQATTFLGWVNPWFIIAIGLGLVGFSIVVIRAIFTLNTQIIKSIILMDILWVVISAGFLITP